MNEMEIYFTRQNLLWNIGFYFIILILIFVFILFIIDFISRLNLKYKFEDFLKKEHNKFWKKGK